MTYTVQITVDDQNRRLDRILRKAFPDLPLSAIHRLLRKGQVYIDGLPVTAPFRPQAGSILEIRGFNPEATHYSREIIRPVSQTERSLSPGAPFEILFENEALLCINKRVGLPVHGETSLDEEVQRYLKPLLQTSLSFKPGPLHRLDQGTSGVIVFSKNLIGAQRFSEALREHRLGKWYITILQGKVKSVFFWQDMLHRDSVNKVTQVNSGARDGKAATTTVYPLMFNNDETNPAMLVAIKLGTGRTHQIRAQAAAHGFPVWGDVKYGAQRQPKPWLLHAYELEGLDQLDLEAPRSIQAPLSEIQLYLMERIFFNKENNLFFKRLRKTPPISDLLDAIIK